MRMILALVVWTVLVGCSSPAPVRTYTGPKRESGQIAVIRPTTKSLLFPSKRQDVYILRVDGASLSKADVDGQGPIEMLPGTHRVNAAAMIQHGGRRIPFEDPKQMVVQFDAGKLYSVYCVQEEGPGPRQAIVRFWMEDSSGNVVAGTR